MSHPEIEIGETYWCMIGKKFRRVEVKEEADEKYLDKKLKFYRVKIHDRYIGGNAVVPKKSLLTDRPGIR